METRRPFNPMPESLDDVKPGANDVLGPQRGQAPQGVMGEPLQDIVGTKKIEEIDKEVATHLTNQQLETEILNEKIRQDLENTKKNNDVKNAKTARDVLKNLISLGEHKEDVVLFNHVWTIKALNQGDITAAFSDVKDDNLTSAGRVSVLILSQIAYAIEACDGQPIYEWFPDLVKKQDYSSAEDFKLAARRTFRRYLERMPSSVINKFNEAYGKIESKRNEAIEELKNS